MKRNLEAFKERTFDLCVVGGGITGAGVALDASTRGWSVALIDKADFASGTSSASSKLAHGGLRYLEYGHFSLVHEALVERGRLLSNAAHLVQPLPFVLPIYRGQRLRPWQWRLGLTLYDLLAGSENIARSRGLSLRAMHSAYPDLIAHDLIGGAHYHDALMDDARVCIAVLQTAAHHGAVLANYVEAVEFEKHGGAIAGVWAKDRLTGQTFLIRARCLLNAAGPWADTLCRLAGDESGPLLEPTKGVHLIVPALGRREAFLLLHPADGRVFFVIPWLGRTLIGTTDTEADASPDLLQVQPSEIDYLLDGYNHFFATKLTPQDVMGSFAGLRPLVRAQPNAPSARSREFRLHVSPSGLVTALGGKYTTFRHMAETIVDFFGRRIGKSRRCRTHALKLIGTPEQAWPAFFAANLELLQRRYSIGADAAAHLLNRHGNRVELVIAMFPQVIDGFARVHPDEPNLVGEEAYARAEEMAIFHEDVYLRRSRVGMWRPELLRQSDYSGVPTSRRLH
jgi:glycerol-3-phosphate dehydrogenase